VYDEENESVVAEVLKSRRGEGWHLVAPPRLASWKRRGHAFDGLSDEESECLVRCDPSDGANGFFVALFEKGSTKRGREDDDKEEEEEEEESEKESEEEEEVVYWNSPSLSPKKKKRRNWVPLHRKGAQGW
jgi:hypothetical protein